MTKKTDGQYGNPESDQAEAATWLSAAEQVRGTSTWQHALKLLANTRA